MKRAIVITTIMLVVPIVALQPPAKADYQRCVTVKPGPIQRPDLYNAHPFGRKKDVT